MRARCSCHSERSEAATQRTKSARPRFQSLVNSAGHLPQAYGQRCFAPLNMTEGELLRHFKNPIETP
jgi:hypothetical protein